MQFFERELGSYLVLLVLFTTILLGCSASNARFAMPKAEEQMALLKQVKPGMTQSYVEIILGQPFAVQRPTKERTAKPDPKTLYYYSPGLRALERKIALDMRENRQINSIEEAALMSISLAAMASTASGAATKLGSPMIGAVAEQASNQLLPEDLNPSNVMTLTVTYDLGVVTSLSIQKLSSLPR